MIIKEIAAAYGRKKSDGEYGSRDVFFSLTATLGEGEDPKKAQQELFDMCHQMVVTQYTGEDRPAQGYQPAQPSKPAKPPVKKSSMPEFILERLQERNEEHGLDNGPRGSKFESEDVTYNKQ